MIKYEEVIALGEKVFNKVQIQELKATKGTKWERMFLEISFNLIRDEALDSVYNGDCDLAIFSQYKLFRDFMELYNKYKDEQYAIGS